MKFNFNDQVRVKLDARGRAIYEQYYFDLSRRLGFPVVCPVDGEGWSQFPLRRLLTIFGPHVGIGYDVPFAMDAELVPRA